MELLRAKQAIIKMIFQFCNPIKIESIGDDELYFYDYCESVLESAFNVLGIDGDYIKVIDLCKMEEDIFHQIWNINFPNEPCISHKWEDSYKYIKKEYELRQRWDDDWESK